MGRLVVACIIIGFVAGPASSASVSESDMLRPSDAAATDTVPALIDKSPVRPTRREPGRDTYRISFVGGELARVDVSARGGGLLTLHVFDRRGGEVCAAGTPDEHHRCEWHPATTAEFVIEVRNHDERGVDYRLWTN